MRGIGQFMGQVLARPMLIVLSTPPQPGCAHVIHTPPEGHPDLRLIGTVPQTQLPFGDDLICQSFLTEKRHFTYMVLYSQNNPAVNHYEYKSITILPYRASFPQRM